MQTSTQTASDNCLMAYHWHAQNAIQAYLSSTTLATHQKIKIDYLKTHDSYWLPLHTLQYYYWHTSHSPKNSVSQKTHHITRTVVGLSYKKNLAQIWCGLLYTRLPKSHAQALPQLHPKTVKKLLHWIYGRIIHCIVHTHFFFERWNTANLICQP